MYDKRMMFLSAALLTTFLALPGAALAQDSSKVVPANAQAKQYGSGWECKTGFRRDGAGCTAVKLPANAYLSDDTYGPGWACKREYKADGNSCVAVKLPQNAYLAGSSYSDDWECERGFRKAGAACVLVTVPKNGYLSDSKPGLGLRTRLSRDGRCLCRREGAAERVSLGCHVWKRLAVRTRLPPVRPSLRAHRGSPQRLPRSVRQGLEVRARFPQGGPRLCRHQGPRQRASRLFRQ